MPLIDKCINTLELLLVKRLKQQRVAPAVAVCVTDEHFDQEPDINTGQQDPLGNTESKEDLLQQQEVQEDSAQEEKDSGKVCDLNNSATHDSSEITNNSDVECSIPVSLVQDYQVNREPSPGCPSSRESPMSVLCHSSESPHSSAAHHNAAKTMSECPPSPTVTSSISPPGEVVLDFSTRRSPRCVTPEKVAPMSENGPLDLSVSNRKRTTPEPISHGQRKSLRTSVDQPPAAWPSPYFAAVAAGLANGRNTSSIKASTNDGAKALEKMGELSRLGSSDESQRGRHGAWQSHWLSKGAEQARDVLKCVWCKQSFQTLAAMTVHMKEAKHCGMNAPASSLTASSPQPPPSQIASPKQPQNELSLLIKDSMPLPRKLVRGQDVWLGKGAEQTRQILKCMWCGQSFRSLAEMTSHMQQTQHYTNIISQEQIISWKSSDEKGGSAQNSSGNSSSAAPHGPGGHVSAVLTCKVCDQAFSSLKELSNHMVKNSHYKEHIMRSITESGGRRRQTREKRKKSLPVRKLLELERAQNELKNGDAPTGRISCEKCGEKIDTSVFVEHIRQCVGGSTSQRNLLKNALLVGAPGGEHILPPSQLPENNESAKAVSPTSLGGSSPPLPEKSSSPSVLNAIEQLIEKSFDSRTRHGANYSPHCAPMGSSILKRLGIDDSVDYTKPLVDAQTVALLRSYQQNQNQQQQCYSRRERSGSESSSVSDRGGRQESLTPDSKMEPPAFAGTPRSTPDRRVSTPQAEESPTLVRVKLEPGTSDIMSTDLSKISMKKEPDDESRSPQSRRATPSPAAESPRSTPGTSGRKDGGSLGALSSMFDSLSGTSSTSQAQTENSSGQKRPGSHPLAALQKLCDKTENHHSTRSQVTPATAACSTSSSTGSATGAILAFSWACNDAVVNSDSVMKCAFCDTPFISKGAYRHHLSKMHFVKDGALPEPVAITTPKLTTSESGPSPVATTATNSSKSSVLQSNAQISSPSSQSASFDESPHSKFLKYTELAKQLSSKYV
ncbi:protein tiptop-like [Ctenocephalides felis]|uniref:protein tiptop-like n=1 Tax=Ctenocephalides felis TaxID=7515 RepID=UPI000E6E3601|nr:protein tiptop-like [Ctenocephalides felis]